MYFYAGAVIITGWLLLQQKCQTMGEEDREDPWQGSNPKSSSYELLSQGASPDVLIVSEVGAILTPIDTFMRQVIKLVLHWRVNKFILIQIRTLLNSVEFVVVVHDRHVEKYIKP